MGVLSFHNNEIHTRQIRKSVYTLTYYNLKWVQNDKSQHNEDREWMKIAFIKGIIYTYKLPNHVSSFPKM